MTLLFGVFRLNVGIVCTLFAFYVCVPSLFLLLFGMLAADVFLSFFLSLSLSLSGAGETQAPFGVWVSPSVSSSWTRTPSSTRTSCSAPLTRSSPARPVFFFRRSRGCFFGCGSRCLVCPPMPVCLSVCLDRHPVHHVWEWCTEPVSPPPTPFLPNTVKDSPGRGWGTHFDRQPYCHTLSRH